MMTNTLERYYYVYILRSLKDGNKYTGYTKDLSSRFEAHQNGKMFLGNRLKSYFTSQVEDNSQVEENNRNNTE
jgi:predicted GIY-YIG superfamily endonuclease